MSWLSFLANHLWQSTIFAGAMWVLTVLLKKNAAAVRYGLWMAASMKFLVPFALLVSLGGHLGWRSVPRIAQVPAAQMVKEIGQPFAAADIPMEPVASADFAMPAVTTPDSVPMRTKIVERLPGILLVVWVCGFLVGAGWWARWIWRMHGLRRDAARIEMDGVEIPVLLSQTKMEPCAFGVLRPVLLLPEGIAERLTAPQMRAVVEHELNHVRRRDNVTAAVHVFIETVFWFWPVLRWVRARLMEERERACDEAVLRAGSEPGVYAEGILQVCRFYLAAQPAVAAGVSGVRLKQRIEAIVSGKEVMRMSLLRKMALVVVAVMVVCVPVMFGQMSAAGHSAVDAMVRPLEKMLAPVAGNAQDEPRNDDALYAKGMNAIALRRFSLARLALQTLINIYPDSSYAVQARKAIGDSWFEQKTPATWKMAKSEYEELLRLFPNSEEAADARVKLAEMAQAATVTATTTVYSGQRRLYSVGGSPVVWCWPLEVAGGEAGLVEPRLLESDTLAPSQGVFEGKEELKGLVLVGLVVDETGKTRDVHVVRGLTAGLNARAVETVANFSFAPATLNGRAVAFALDMIADFDHVSVPIHGPASDVSGVPDLMLKQEDMQRLYAIEQQQVEFFVANAAVAGRTYRPGGGVMSVVKLNPAQQRAAAGGMGVRSDAFQTGVAYVGGTVTDAAGAPVEDVTVTATNLATHAVVTAATKRATAIQVTSENPNSFILNPTMFERFRYAEGSLKSSSYGYWSLPLGDGEYSFTVGAKGFAPWTSGPVPVRVGQGTRVDARLSVQHGWPPPTCDPNDSKCSLGN